MKDIIRAGRRLVHRAKDFAFQELSYRLSKSLYVRDFYIKRIKDAKFVNIGSGSFKQPGWTNVDWQSAYYKFNQENKVDINWNALWNVPLPIPSNQCEIVYTSHMIEHIPNHAVNLVLKESHRILKKGGVLRLTTPDIDPAYQAYIKNDRSYFDFLRVVWEGANNTLARKLYEQCSLADLFLWWFATAASDAHWARSPKVISDDELNQKIEKFGFPKFLDECIKHCSMKIQSITPGDHINWWNEKKLTTYLKDVGFSQITRSVPGGSSRKEMQNKTIFDELVPEQSLFMEAVKN